MTPNNPKDLVFHESKRNLRLEDDRALITTKQEIPDDFWDRVAELRHVQDRAPVGEFLQVAAIPEIIVEQWFREGFNIFDRNIGLKEILARLRMEDKERLITTSRSI